MAELDLTAMALAEEPEPCAFSGVVQDSGEGRWTIEAAIEQAVPVGVLGRVALRAIPLTAGSHLRRPGPLGDAAQIRGACRAPRRWMSREA